MNLSDVTKVFEDLTGYIQQGDTAPFENLFTDGHISVNVPRYGQIGNNIVFGRYLRQVRLWMRDRDDLRFEYWGTVPSADEKHLAINGVYYFMIHDAEFDYHKELHIPVSVMCEMEDGKIRTARVYYSTHWVAGHNITRPAMLNEDPTLINSLPELEKLYFKCLWAGDSKPILDRILDHNAYFMGTAYSFNQGPDLVKTFNGLFKDGKNVFFDENGEKKLSADAYHFIAGLLTHVSSMNAILNPLVNSYKRLVPGYEAPCYTAWSASNRSALIRIPAARGQATRVELRCPDPSCNPYLALAVCLAAGLDGIERKLTPPAEITENIFAMTPAEREAKGIHSLPGTLHDAVVAFQKDKLICDTLGEHIVSQYVAGKEKEWDEYRTHVSDWELGKYLIAY